MIYGQRGGGRGAYLGLRVRSVPLGVFRRPASSVGSWAGRARVVRGATNRCRLGRDLAKSCCRSVSGLWVCPTRPHKGYGQLAYGRYGRYGWLRTHLTLVVCGACLLGHNRGAGVLRAVQGTHAADGRAPSDIVHMAALIVWIPVHCHSGCRTRCGPVGRRARPVLTAALGPGRILSRHRYDV